MDKLQLSSLWHWRDERPWLTKGEPRWSLVDTLSRGGQGVQMAEYYGREECILGMHAVPWFTLISTASTKYTDLCNDSLTFRIFIRKSLWNLVHFSFPFLLKSIHKPLSRWARMISYLCLIWQLLQSLQNFEPSVLPSQDGLCSMLTIFVEKQSNLRRAVPGGSEESGKK